MPTPITQDESWRVIDAVRVEVADLFDGLTPEQRRRPSLCDAWTVRDVAAHLSMAALASTGFALRTAARQGFRFDAVIREGTLAWSRGLDDAAVSGSLRGLVGVRRLAPSTMWRDPLIDALVHVHDLADPLGLPVTEHPEAAATAADWAWGRPPLGFPFLPTWRLRGLRLVATDVDWARGAGDEVRGPVTDLLLVSTGRRGAYPRLEGPGADRARAVVAEPKGAPA
ncbi:maleylpyruvate isomerase family mycothiol-dependent enzyme [Phycicoccus flavus]|uniref:maleylpyruvate isomerase family mycothiol-dependent enzyme n=1 Tax=Phycicoccus flavus TaxID=2502783 RepID=UPI000FEC013B|nr:maleylpyruvate isomerase family mycothiol-dependent enzyme [Phycicoccus flavus]NHA68108.1 maleylpyruvate isomerase family mycothiol-dependent enzyme [Phycicoccus flavus]